MKRLTIALLLSLTTLSLTACFGGEETVEEGVDLGGEEVSADEVDLPDLPSTF